jgi:hypothetical protein
MIVLIFMSYMYGQVDGPLVTPLDFSSEDKCEAAAKAITEQLNKWKLDRQGYAFCVPK